MNCLKMLMSLLIVIGSAYLSYDFLIESVKVPFTGQSIAIMIVAAYLSPKESVVVILIYLLMGGLGLPVFSGGASGWDKFLSGSGGFLYGFVFVAFYISLKFKANKLNYFEIVRVLLIATLIMFTFGLSHLSFKYGFKDALAYGFTPFVIPALIKALLASVVIYLISPQKIKHLSS